MSLDALVERVVPRARQVCQSARLGEVKEHALHRTVARRDVAHVDALTIGEGLGVNEFVGEKTGQVHHALMATVGEVTSAAIRDLERGKRTGEQRRQGLLGVERARIEDVDVPHVEQAVGRACADRKREQSSSKSMYMSHLSVLVSR